MNEPFGIINLLRCSDVIWEHRSGSTLAQVMTCCLTAPSHFLNQCWHIVNGILCIKLSWNLNWHITRSIQKCIGKCCLQIWTILSGQQCVSFVTECYGVYIRVNGVFSIPSLQRQLCHPRISSSTNSTQHTSHLILARGWTEVVPWRHLTSVTVSGAKMPGRQSKTT